MRYSTQTFGGRVKSARKSSKGMTYEQAMESQDTGMFGLFTQQSSAANPEYSHHSSAEEAEQPLPIAHDPFSPLSFFGRARFFPRLSTVLEGNHESAAFSSRRISSVGQWLTSRRWSRATTGSQPSITHDQAVQTPLENVSAPGETNPSPDQPTHMPSIDEEVGHRSPGSTLDNRQTHKSSASQSTLTMGDPRPQIEQGEMDPHLATGVWVSSLSATRASLLQSFRPKSTVVKGNIFGDPEAESPNLVAAGQAKPKYRLFNCKFLVAVLLLLFVTGIGAGIAVITTGAAASGNNPTDVANVTESPTLPSSPTESPTTSSPTTHSPTVIISPAPTPKKTKLPL